MQDSEKYQGDIKLYDLLYLSAKNALILQNEEGAFPGGHNGVRIDPETPVRNTSHWLITMLKMYSHFKEKVFKDSADKAVNYLLSREARPMQATFWHRKKTEKDFCNGLMGQAYTIEALAIAYKETQNIEIKKVAEEVFLMHPFDEKTGLWQRVAVDGSHLTADETFNHQLWFAASGALLWDSGANEEINRCISIFINNLPLNMRLYKLKNKGLIIHPLLRNLSKYNNKINKFNSLITHIRQIKKKKIMHAIGYHAFNLYALAVIKRIYPIHPFWESEICASALKYAKSKTYIDVTEDPRFSIPHSPAGSETSFFERAFVLNTFFPNEDNAAEQQRLISLQFNKSYDFDENMLNKCTADPVTQSARIYKATRLPDISVCINDKTDVTAKKSLCKLEEDTEEKDNVPISGKKTSFYSYGLERNRSCYSEWFQILGAIGYC